MDPSHEKTTSDAERATSAASPDIPSKAPQMPNFPEGGARAWLVVLGAAIVNACSFGYSSSFGVYQAYYQYNQLADKTPSQVAWIGSLQLCFLFGGGFVAGPLFDRYGSRVVMIPASVGYALSIIFTSLCTEYWHFLLAQGIFGGLCTGFIFSPSIAAVGHYFAKKRGIAMGLVAVGSSLGGVIFPIVLEKAFSSKVGFGWGVRGVGLVTLFLLGIACLLVKERLPPRKGAIFATQAATQASYMFAVFGVFLLIWGVFVVYFFLSEYAIEKLHMSTTLAFYLLSILNGASLFGRLFFGAMGDKLGVFNLICFAGIANGILVFCWTTTSSNAGVIVWAIVFGFTSGGIFSLFPAILAHIAPGPQLIGAYIGQAMAAFAISGLTGAPITGQIVAKYGFFDASVFGGLALLVGAGLLICARHAHQPDWSVKA